MGAAAADAVRTLRLDYYHTGNAKTETLQPRSRRRRAAAVAGESGAADRRHEPRQVLLRGDRPRDQSRRSTRAASRRSTASGRRRPRRRRSARTFSRVAALSRAVEQPVQVVVKKRDAANAFREVWTLVVDPADKFVDTASAAVAGPRLIELHEERRPGDEGRPADSRRRLHRRRARKFETRRAAAGRHAVRDLAVQGAPSRLQRLGPVSAGRRVRHLAAVARDPPAVAGRRHLRRVRFRALRPDVRQPGVPRHRRATRRTTSSRSSSNGRTYGGGGIFNLYAPSRPTALWAPYIFVHEFGHHFAASPTSTTRPTSPTCRAGESRRAVGAERHGAARSGSLEVEGPRHARHAAADAVGEGGVRGDADAIPERGAARSARRTGPRRRWTRSSARKNGATTDALAATAVCGEGRRVRRRELRGAAATTGRRRTASCSRATVPFCAVCRRALTRILDLYSRP